MSFLKNNLLISVLSTLILVLLVASSPSFGVTRTHNVLVVHSYHHEHFWTGNIKRGLNDSFLDDPQVRLFHETMDAKRYPNGEFSESFLSYLIQKYSKTELDAIVISDDPAFNLIRENREVFFSDVPIIFLGINRVTDEVLNSPNMTGIFENRNIAGTITSIKKHTGNDNLILVVDKTATGQANLAKAQAAFDSPDVPSKIFIFDELIDQNIVKEFSEFDRDIPILLIGQMTSPSRNNALLSWNEGTEQLVKWTKNPIYTIAISTLANGALGADELDAYQHAQQAAELLKRLLSGIAVDDIEPITIAQSQWIFNWDVMQQYQFSEQSLPPGSRIINREESFYQKYKLMVQFVIAAFAISILIIILLIEVIRRGNKNRNILEENEARYRDLAHAGANIFWEMDSANYFSYMSGDPSLFYGTDISDIVGKTLAQLCKSNPAIEFNWAQYESILAARKPLNNLILKVKLPSKDLNIFVINGKAIFDKNRDFIGYRGISKDITQEHLLSQKLAYQANYDELTGLINRSSFNERLKNHVEQNTQGQTGYICYLDLDRFKLINDTAGHLIGDAMLAEISQLIERSVGSKGILGRLGGDEFGLIILGQSQAQAQSLCEQIIEDINAYRFHWNQRLFNVGISIGMVPITFELSVTELLSKADLCCYRAKDLGRGRVYIANLDSDDLYDEQLQMGYIANVAQAIEQNQFYLVKQLIKPSHNDDYGLTHYEMLIRYRDENGKIIAPGLFIPAAEKHSVITLIDHWVLQTVLDRYDEFFPQGNTQVSINLSGMSLSNEGFVSEVSRLLTQSNVRPELICFEITETAAISQLGKAQEFISEMKSLGIKFAIDDFGSGASSFSYLKNLPVDYLKIDGSLIRHIVNDPSDRAIVEAIHSIAKMMDMRTVAEFVENDDIIAVLQEIGVDYLQGYGIEKPWACE